MAQWVKDAKPVSGEFFIEDLKKYLIYQLDKQHNTVVKLSPNSQFDKQIEPKKSTRVKRNESCPCGSNVKYKKCCGGGGT
jgi:uncharacterized protein YecA (UPF0149 family)